MPIHKHEERAETIENLPRDCARCTDLPNKVKDSLHAYQLSKRGNSAAVDPSRYQNGRSMAQ